MQYHEPLVLANKRTCPPSLFDFIIITLTLITYQYLFSFYSSPVLLALLIRQHPCSNGVSARVRKSNAGQGQARQTKSNRENRYVIKVMNEHREGGQVLWSARTKGCLKPFNWSIINLIYIYSNL